MLIFTLKFCLNFVKAAIIKILVLGVGGDRNRATVRVNFGLAVTKMKANVVLCLLNVTRQQFAS